MPVAIGGGKDDAVSARSRIVPCTASPRGVSFPSFASHILSARCRRMSSTRVEKTHPMCMKRAAMMLTLLLLVVVVCAGTRYSGRHRHGRPGRDAQILHAAPLLLCGMGVVLPVSPPPSQLLPLGRHRNFERWAEGLAASSRCPECLAVNTQGTCCCVTSEFTVGYTDDGVRTCCNVSGQDKCLDCGSKTFCSLTCMQNCLCCLKCGSNCSADAGAKCHPGCINYSHCCCCVSRCACPTDAITPCGIGCCGMKICGRKSTVQSAAAAMDMER